MTTSIAPAEKSLYDQLREAGCEMDSWQSDLYVVATPEARAIIKEYEDGGHISNKTSFRSQQDGRRWFELPFHFKPWWTARIPEPEPAMEGEAPRV